MEATITSMVTKARPSKKALHDAAIQIRRGARPHLYVTEWFEQRGVNDEKVGDRIGVDRATIFRWRKEQHRLNPDKIAALAKALDLEPEDLWRPPARPSLDALIKDAPDDVVSMAFDIVKRMAGGAQ